jgi:hypothetical protein
MWIVFTLKKKRERLKVITAQLGKHMSESHDGFLCQHGGKFNGII